MKGNRQLQCCKEVGGWSFPGAKSGLLVIGRSSLAQYKMNKEYLVVKGRKWGTLNRDLKEITENALKAFWVNF